MSVDVLVRNNVNVLGTGSQTIMFAHGFGCDQDMWRHIVPAFEQYRIVLFDYVGSGSPKLTIMMRLNIIIFMAMPRMCWKL